MVGEWGKGRANWRAASVTHCDATGIPTTRILVGHVVTADRAHAHVGLCGRLQIRRLCIKGHCVCSYGWMDGWMCVCGFVCVERLQLRARIMDDVRQGIGPLS